MTLDGGVGVDPRHEAKIRERKEPVIQCCRKIKHTERQADADEKIRLRNACPGSWH